jgi:hypothetical protein
MKQRETADRDDLRQSDAAEGQRETVEASIRIHEDCDRKAAHDVGASAKRLRERTPTSSALFSLIMPRDGRNSR